MTLQNTINANSTTPLPVSAGGTGGGSFTTHGILVGEGTSPVNPIVLTNGQLLIGSTGADPVAATLTAGTGITISNAAGTVTINAASTGFNSAQMRYVDPNGNDTTGNGSITNPFLTIGHTLTSITDSSSTKPYIVNINAGTYSETGLEVPVWVFLNGSAQQPTKIIDSSGSIKINSSSFSAGSERIGFANLNLINSTGLTIDFQAIGGSGSNQIYLNNNQIVGPIIFRGRGSDALTGFDNRFFGTYTSSAMQEVHYSGYFANNVIYNTLGVTGVAVEPELTAMSCFENVTFTSSGAGNTMVATMISSQVSSTLTVDQSTTTLYADEVSLNAGTLSITNSGIIDYLSVAQYEGYTPSTPGNWSPTPTQVAEALDQLAAHVAAEAFIWSVVTSSTSLIANKGYFANNIGALTFTLPVSAAVGDTFAVSEMSSGTFIVAQNSGQQIRFGDINTTSGTGGSLISTAAGDTVTLVCTVANTNFQVVSSIGNITYI